MTDNENKPDEEARKRASTAEPRKLPDGRWEYRIDVGIDPATGKRRQRRLRGKSKRDVLDQADAVRRDVTDGRYVPPSDAKVTVAAFARDEWLPGIKMELEPSTLASYADMLTGHVLPRIGALPLGALTPAGLNAMYAELLENGRRNGKGGLSPRTVQYVHAVVHRMLRDAVAWGRVGRNVAEVAKGPSPKQARAPEMKFWTPTEFRGFLEFVDGDPIAVPVRLAGMTGMRRGEVYGLCWRDLDLDARRVTVRRQLRMIRGRLDHVNIAKTSAAHATIDLDEETCVMLRAHRVRQHRERLACGAGYRDHDLVFAAPDGELLDPAMQARRFDRLVAKSEQPRIRFHDLRHTHAATLIAAGTHVKVVSARLRHTSTSFTLDRYGHLGPSLGSEAATAAAVLVDGPG